MPNENQSQQPSAGSQVKASTPDGKSVEGVIYGDFIVSNEGSKTTTYQVQE